MSNIKTIQELLENGKGDSIAISAPNRTALTFSGLRDHVANTVDTLNAFGIGRNDPVAIVLPNGPEMASAFISIAAGATTAPLPQQLRRSLRASGRSAHVSLRAGVDGRNRAALHPPHWGGAFGAAFQAARGGLWLA